MIAFYYLYFILVKNVPYFYPYFLPPQLRLLALFFLFTSLFLHISLHIFLSSLLHMQHHVCTVCERPFQGHPFYERGGRAYCERHFDMVRGLSTGLTLVTAPPPCLATVTRPPYKGLHKYKSFLISLSTKKWISWQTFFLGPNHTSTLISNEVLFLT